MKAWLKKPAEYAFYDGRDFTEVLELTKKHYGTYEVKIVGKTSGNILKISPLGGDITVDVYPGDYVVRVGGYKHLLRLAKAEFEELYEPEQ